MSVTILKSNLSYMGGLEKYAIKTAKAFLKKGHKVTLLTTGAVPEIDVEHLNIVSLGKPSSLSILNLKQFDKQCQIFLHKHPSPIIFGFDRNRYQTHYRAGNGVHASYLNQRKYTDSFLKYLSFSVNPLHRYLLRTENILFNHPQLQRLFTNSHMVKKELQHYYQVDTKKIKVVHNGVDWEGIQTYFDTWEANRPSLYQPLGLDKDTFHFLFIGNGYKRKGLHLLLHTLAKLTHYDFQLSVIGKDRKINNFIALSKKLGIEKRIKFYGHQTQLQPFYQVADALVIPSLYDPFASVTLEALAMGLYVISSKFNGGHEILNEENGTIIDNLFDQDSLASHVIKALTYPKTMTRSIAIRNSIKFLNLSTQLNKMIDYTLQDV